MRRILQGWEIGCCGMLSAVVLQEEIMIYEDCIMRVFDLLFSCCTGWCCGIMKNVCDSVRTVVFAFLILTADS